MRAYFANKEKYLTDYIMTDLKTNPPANADEAWKHVLNAYFELFMRFFYPDVAQKIGWTAGYEMLDQELLKITSDSMIGLRRVDKLVKVKSLEGKDFLVLLHLEIQGTKDQHFEKRLFQYFYRLYDRYELPILTLAILADEHTRWRPCGYSQEVWGYQVCCFQFLINKLLDYQGQEDQLIETDNPFGTVVAAHLAGLKTRSKPEARYATKLTLTRKLYDKGLSRDEIINLYTFIDSILTLPENLENRYNESIEELEQERNMHIVTSMERFGMQKGKLEAALALAGRMLEKFSLEEVKVIVKDSTGLDITDKDVAGLDASKPAKHTDIKM